MEELVGELIMLTPIEVESVPQPKEFGGGMKDRLTADTVVLTGQRAGEYPSMWWGQSGIVKKGKDILRANRGDLILGRIYRFPKRDMMKHYPSPAALEAAFKAAADGKAPPVPNTAYFWSINDPAQDEIQAATEYLGGKPLKDPSLDEEDPFAGDE
jgi:hypothetical protein